MLPPLSFTATEATPPVGDGVTVPAVFGVDEVNLAFEAEMAEVDWKAAAFGAAVLSLPPSLLRLLLPLRLLLLWPANDELCGKANFGSPL